MKKAAILSITAFYLLLTTGMFVCIVHCSAEAMIIKPVMHLAYAGHHHKDSCKSGKDCDCCKKHGTYIIKENIKPVASFDSQQFAIIIDHPLIENFIQEYPTTATLAWRDSNAPPWKSGKAISIQFRSLQI
jgi:hypothetical protein